jgi:hypothetical protein
MAAYTSNPIIDPDSLSYATTGVSIASIFAAATDELLIDYANKKLALKVTGTLTNDGVTIKCVYSKLKEIWRTDSTLIKFPFPMGPITDEQFEMVNGWNWDKTETSGTGGASLVTVELLRTGGWSVVKADAPNIGAVQEMWAGIITLGSFVDTSDQAYFQQETGGSATNFKLSNNVNQAVQIYSDPNGDGAFGDGYDRRTYFKIFLREYQKTYAQSANTEIGASSMTYQAYRFPLSNASDLKITNDDTAVSTTTPYTEVNITYLRHTDDTRYNVRGAWVTATSYALADVVQGTDSRWYKCILAHTSGGSTQPITGGSYLTNWAAYEGERLIGSSYYPFTVIIDADTDVAASVSGDASRTQVYEKVQYLLRQNSDIDADASASVTGKTADLLLRFVGDTLITSNGVYIDSFNTNDINDIEFYDATGVKRTFPYVATITINFGDNLKNDASAKYWLFFSTLPGANNDFGESGAVLVKDNSTVDVTGDVSAASSVTWSFDYDNNTQGGRTSGTNADVTAVGLGLSTGQYVKATATIARSKANSVSLVAALERNYSNT